MKMAGFEFEVDSKNVDERHPANTLPDDIPAFLARKKARAFLDDIDENTIVIGADTIVILDDKIYEKPADRQHAIDMLATLSGKVHRVVTGVCILSKQKEVLFSETTKVYFNPFTINEITYYVDNYKPFDKAGAYACQEWIGAIGISRFEGDYFNVVGLPVNRVYQELKAF
jgi:septum formation protein